MKTGVSSTVARIDALRCIGCTRCIDACPFDAIIGAPQRMHTVIADECIGCELCVAPCPVDCIEMLAADSVAPMSRGKAIAARRQREQRNSRLARERHQIDDAVPRDPSAILAAAVQRAGKHAGRPAANVASGETADDQSTGACPGRSA